MAKIMMFPDKTCKEIVEQACAEAVEICVTFDAKTDRTLCVQVVANMLWRLARAQGLVMKKEQAHVLAELQVGSFSNYHLPKLAAYPAGKTLYAKAKRSLVESIGQEACAFFSASAA